MESDYTRLLNASTHPSNSDHFAGLYAELKKTVRRHWELAKVWLYRAIEKKT